jgi:hypothetical protein
MTEPKGKDELLSVGAKTYILKLAKEFVYGYEEKITSKYMDKGILMEDESIKLYNSVFFTGHTKNIERKTNEWLTGECDIFTGNKIIDIKTSWSLATFPCIVDECVNKDYEWQLRAYMMLWNVDQAELAYCMVNTPDDLMKYEQADLHHVDHINEVLRVTTLSFDRDVSLEEKIKQKVGACSVYFNDVCDLIAHDHNQVIQLKEAA